MTVNKSILQHIISKPRLLLQCFASPPAAQTSDIHETGRKKNTWRSDTPTYEGYGLWEELGQILTPVVRNGNLLVSEAAIVLKHVGEVGRHIQNVLDVAAAQHIQVGGVFGAAQVKVRQDLHGEGRLAPGDGALLGFRGAARLPVRLPVGAVGADPQISETQDGQWGRGAGAGAVDERLAVFRELCVELSEPTWNAKNKRIGLPENTWRKLASLHGGDEACGRRG